MRFLSSNDWNQKSGMLAVMQDETPRRRGRPIDPTSRNQQMSKDDPRYQPTKADLEEDMRVGCSFEELTDIMFGRNRPRRVLH